MMLEGKPRTQHWTWTLVSNVARYGSWAPEYFRCPVARHAPARGTLEEKACVSLHLWLQICSKAHPSTRPHR